MNQYDGRRPIGNRLHIGCVVACGVRDEASDRKMDIFMMDGVYFGVLSVVFGTVRQFFRHFDDGRSERKISRLAAAGRNRLAA